MRARAALVLVVLGAGSREAAAGGLDPANVVASIESLAESVAAALDAEAAFARAEAKRLVFERFAITAPLTTNRDATAVLDQLDQLAKDARDAYLKLAQTGFPSYRAAAEVRIADLFYCQAAKLTAIPLSPSIAGVPASAQAMYRETLMALGWPLRDQAKKQWRVAQDLADQVPPWDPWPALASARLDGRDLPTCRGL